MKVANQFHIQMDPNLNRNSLGSRAGTSIKPKFGAGAPSRLGTASKNLNPLGGVGSTVEVVDRPLTMNGINGPQGASTQRKVYDLSYYVTKTKEKLLTIQEETQRLKSKAEQIGKEQQVYNKLEAKLEDLNLEVRGLEGQLADYNLALDKLRINTRPEDVKNTYMHVKNQNQKLKAQLDDIFLSRKKIEEETEYYQSEMAAIHKQMELRLNELDPYQRNQYQKLMTENSQLINQYNKKAHAMQELLNKLDNAQKRLKMDSQKLKGKFLKQQITQLQTKKTDYQIQLNQANLSVPQARERILNRMKEDNGLIANIEKRNKEVKKNIDVYEKKIRELQANLQDKKTQEEQKKQYEILYQHDKDMDKFLNSFQQIRSQQISQLNGLQRSVHQLLEQIAKVLEISNQLPTQGATRADRSQNTLAQTKTQYEIRLNSIRALQNTQKRTQEEIIMLKNNILKMKEQINQKFDKVQSVKESLNRKRVALTQQEKSLNQAKAKLGPQVSLCQTEANTAEKKYQVHEGYSSYATSEKKLAELQGRRYYLRHYINTKSKDINYEDLKNQCMAFVEELNKKIAK